jgi:glucan phosphoethanolaminetransferase (alkaline phosphatase superfamily)
MDNAFNLLLVILVGGLSLLALFAALVLLFPKQIMRTQLVLENTGGRSLLLGLVNFIFFGLLVILGVWLAQKTSGVLAGIFILLSGVIALAIAVLMLTGLVALAQLLGVRIGDETTPFRTILRGGGLLLLAGLAPYLGWFLFAPLAAWGGLGAAIQALVLRRKSDSDAGA